MILVTGAAGKTGQAVISALAGRDEPVRALVRREAQAQVVRRVGAAQVMAGDMRHEALLLAACRDVRALYHIAPNMHPDEVAMGRLALSAAREAGVQRFVYHSVLHPQTEAMPHHWRKLRVEEMILESTPAFTILQPAAYMQNIRGSWQAIVREGTFRVPYPVTTRLSLVHLHDVGQVAAKVLLEPGHEGATYELVGTRPLAQTEVAGVLGRVLGWPVQAQEVPLEEWQRDAEASGMPSDTVSSLLKMFRYYADNGFSGNPQVLSWLLDRAPATLETFARQLAEEQGE